MRKTGIEGLIVRALGKWPLPSLEVEARETAEGRSHPERDRSGQCASTSASHRAAGCRNGARAARGASERCHWPPV